LAADSKSSKKSIDSVRSLKHLRKGLAIYKTGRSPFWYIRLRDPLTAKYVVRSSREKSRHEAIEAAFEFADTYHSRANSVFAQSKDASFEHYGKILLQSQKTKTNWSHRDNRILSRPKDGLIFYFGKYDVTKVTSGMVRKYLSHLDENRATPLAESTKSKHVILIKKVLMLAVDDGLMRTLPPMPKAKRVDTPRHAFTDKEYERFSQAALACAERGDIVRGARITGHHAKMFNFVVHSFLRPSVGELFGLKHKDIQQDPKTNYLTMTIRRGKTGRRESVTMPFGAAIYGSSGSNMQLSPPDPEEYVWMPDYPNRTTAIDTARRIFNHILQHAGLDDQDKKLTPYSLRHYALQRRLRGSNGKVDIHTLAKNAGTSVDQLERFYLARMAPTPEMIENLHTTGAATNKRVVETRDYHTSILEANEEDEE